MEGGRPITEQALPPAEETELTYDLPETRSNRLGHLYDLFRKRTGNTEKPPEFAPPLPVEQLVEAAASAGVEAEAMPAVEIETIQDSEEEAEAARQRLEKAFEAVAETAPEEEEELPEEAQYERRAETSLGNDDVNQQNLIAAVTKILTDIKQKTADAHANFNKWKPQTPKINLPLPALLTNLPLMYQQAILAGFVAAAAILLALIII